MNYHVNRDGNDQGIHTLDQLREGYKNGQFLPRDLVWREGMPEWIALSELPELATPAPEAIPGAGGFTPPPQPEAAERTGPAWENAGQGSVFDRAWTTIREAATNPQVFFRTMRLEGGLGAPLVFSLVLSFIAVLINAFLETPLQLALGNPFEEVIVGVVVVIILVPLLVPLSAFISSGLIHLCLMMLGSANKPYEATFRVVCYANGAVALVQIVPFCGAYVAGIWALVLSIIGISAAHNVSGGKASAAVLIPIAFCCAAVFGLALVITASMGLAFSGF